MAKSYHIFDVFTSTPLSGNPLAIVEDSGDLSSSDMQKIAAEFNLSETVFLLPADNSAHSARMRIFTTTSELPFAGHPTIGTAVFLAQKRAQEQGLNDNIVIILEQSIGFVRCSVRLSGTKAHVEFSVPVLPKSFDSIFDRNDLADLLSLNKSEIGFENFRPRCLGMDASHRFMFVPLQGLEAMSKLSFNAETHGHLVKRYGMTFSVYAYCRETEHVNHSFHARMFAPLNGISEDPATGSAAVCLSNVINEFDAPGEGSHSYIIEQGYEMGRESEIGLTFHVHKGHVSKVVLSGQAVRFASGAIDAYTAGIVKLTSFW